MLKAGCMVFAGSVITLSSGNDGFGNWFEGELFVSELFGAGDVNRVVKRIEGVM